MKNYRCIIEPLESRIAPAAVIITGKIAKWTDFDGDTVTMSWTGSLPPTFTAVTPADSVSGGVLISEVVFNNAYDSITVTVKQAPTGDGHVSLGYMDATNLGLKSFVAPKASVMEFDCGSGATGIGTLVIGSYGTTNPAAFGAVAGADGIGRLNGDVGTVKIAGDLEYGRLAVGNAAGGSKIGSISIAGNLKGDGLTGVDTGVLELDGPAGSVGIRGSIIGTGNATTNNGLLFAKSPIKSLSVGGDVIGGTVLGSGEINVNDVAALTIKGSVLGGSGLVSGNVYAQNVGTLTIGNSIVGAYAGTAIVSCISAKVIEIGGSLVGGSPTFTGSSTSDGGILVHENVGKIAIGHNIETGTVDGTGDITFDGGISVDGNLGSLVVGGNIVGSNGQRAIIVAQGAPPAAGGNFDAIARITVTGSVSFATIESGQQDATTDGNFGDAEQPDAGIGSVTIGGDYYHSSIMAGINEKPSALTEPNGIYPTDTASGNAVLGPISIGGSILDDSSSAGYSGFEAHIISKIVEAGHIRFLTGEIPPVLDPAGFVLVREI